MYIVFVMALFAATFAATFALAWHIMHWHVKAALFCVLERQTAYLLYPLVCFVNSGLWE